MDEKYVNNAIDYITHLCNQYGPRITCSPEEKEAAKDLHGMLGKYCDDTYLDKFDVFPNLYPGGFIKIGAFFVSIGIPCMFLSAPWSILASILPLIGFIQIYITYIKMSEIFGFIFEKETSYNATGRIYPRDEQGNKKKGKKRIIIAGHIDSAFQMKITKHGDKVYKYALPGFLFIILQVLFGTIKTIWGGLGDPTTYVKGYGFSLILLDFIFLGIALFGIPSFLYLVNGLVGGTPVEGANDNLSGVGIALSLAEYFSREENRLKHVELWLGGFGSEECGERGAQHFVEKYGRKGLLDNAYNVIPESCGAGDRLAIITKEPIHLAHHDIELCKKVYKGYERFVRETKSGDPIPCKIQKLPFSASDAGRFSLAGYKATMVIAFEGALAKPKNWHHEDDLPENLDYKMMRTVFGTYKNFIINTDKLENI